MAKREISAKLAKAGARRRKAGGIIGSGSGLKANGKRRKRGGKEMASAYHLCEKARLKASIIGISWHGAA